MIGVLTAGGIASRNGKILLVKKPHIDNKYVIPKGHLEPGESTQEAAVRELLEETGYEVKITGWYGSLLRLSMKDTGELVVKKIDVFKLEVIRHIKGAIDEEYEWVDIDRALTHMLYREERDFLAEHFPKKR